jgi:4-hydroxy-2-oxoheptanedioate aldolase
MKETMRRLEIAGTTPVVGLGICLGSVRIAEMVARTSFDFIMVDMLHSHFDKEHATGAIRTLARSQGPVPFGRVANNDPGTINELLDAGAMGIIIPMVESPAEARLAVESSYYPPLGKRSKGSPAAIFYGSEYYSRINEELNVIVMIETVEAAENAREILAVPGITGCLIGGGDLAYAMKVSQSNENFDTVVEMVVKAAEEHSMAVGISVASTEDLKKWWSQGMNFFLTSHDMGILSAAIQDYEKEFTGPLSLSRR